MLRQKLLARCNSCFRRIPNWNLYNCEIGSDRLSTFQFSRIICKKFNSSLYCLLIRKWDLNIFFHTLKISARMPRNSSMMSVKNKQFNWRRQLNTCASTDLPNALSIFTSALVLNFNQDGWNSYFKFDQFRWLTVPSKWFWSRVSWGRLCPNKNAHTHIRALACPGSLICHSFRVQWFARQQHQPHQRLQLQQQQQQQQWQQCLQLVEFPRQRPINGLVDSCGGAGWRAMCPRVGIQFFPLTQLVPPSCRREVTPSHRQNHRLTSHVTVSLPTRRLFNNPNRYPVPSLSWFLRHLYRAQDR